MRSTSSGFTFSITTLAAVTVIVACSPNSQKVTIGAKAPNGFQQKVSSCTDSIRASEKLKVGAKNKIVICEIPAGKTAAAPVTYPVSFDVQKNDTETAKSEVRLAMTIGFETSESLTKDERANLRDRFAAVCGPATEEIFTRSRVGGTSLKMELKFNFDEAGDVFGDPSQTADQMLRLAKGPQSEDVTYVLDQLPSKPVFFPNGRLSDLKACAAQYAGSVEQKRCAWDKRSQANASVCAAFAKRVGNFVGIVDTEKEFSTCGAVQPTDKTTAPDQQGPGAKPQPTSPNDSSSFAKPRASDAEFMEKAELNRKDLMTILAPVCPDQLKDVK